ncbi:MAG: hypothetical protein AAFR79_19860 [Pseudomonadota bacterium]
MDYGSSETVLTMLKAMAIGLAAGYVIWGWKRPTGSEGSDDAAASEPAETAAEPTPEPDPVETEPESEPAPPPSNLYLERPDHVDNLQEIKGVGPKMEAVLNSKGVYQFAQIAAFTAEDLTWLDKATGSFPGRAARDGWVTQAKERAGG